jgi:ATP-dependent 26S proteasome regulatory subunit
LLNLTDGLLGQGLSLLVAITTNEPLSTLHPAVVRAGRCIAQIEVGNLNDAEAQAWLGGSLPERAEALNRAARVDWAVSLTVPETATFSV